MNKVILIGRLTKDPELTTTGSGISVCRFALAIERKFTNADGEKEVDFLKSISDNTSTKKLVVLDINEHCKLYDCYKNEINIEKYNKSGESIKIGLNYNYFLDVLKHTKSDKITCKFINPHNLITLEDKEINGCNYFLPVRLD